MQTRALPWFLVFREFEGCVLGWVSKASRRVSYWAVAAKMPTAKEGYCSFLSSPQSIELSAQISIKAFHHEIRLQGNFGLSMDSLWHLQSRLKKFKGCEGEAERKYVWHTKPQASRGGLISSRRDFFKGIVKCQLKFGDMYESHQHNGERNKPDVPVWAVWFFL